MIASGKAMLVNTIKVSGMVMFSLYVNTIKTSRMAMFIHKYKHNKSSIVVRLCLFIAVELANDCLLSH